MGKMGTPVKALMGLGLLGATFLGGNLAPGIFDKEKLPSEQVVEGARAIAKNCGVIALTNVLAEEADPSQTAGQFESTAQSDVQDRMASCFNEFVTETAAGVLEGVEVPKVQVEMSLMQANDTETKG